MTALAVLSFALLGAEPLTSDQAVELAVKESPSLRAVAQRVTEEAAKGEVATALENPQLRVQNLRSDRLLSPAITGQPYGPHPFANTSVALRWIPPNPLVNSARHAAAGYQVAGAEAEVEVTRRRVIARVRGLHATVLSLDRQLTLAHTAIELKAQLAKLAGARLEQRASTGLEESLAQLDELEAKAQAVELLRKRREAIASLSMELGLPSDSQLELAGGPTPCVAPAEAPAALIERAIDRDPSVRVHRSRASALEAERGEARLALVPWFDYVQLNYVLASDDRPAYGVLQVGTTLPLLNWNGHKVDLLTARGRREDAERELARRSLAKDIESTVAGIAEHAELIERYHSVEPTLLEQSRAQIDKALAAGAYSLSQVAQAQGRSLNAQRAGLRAELECQLLLVELDRLVGPKVTGETQ